MTLGTTKLLKLLNNKAVLAPSASFPEVEAAQTTSTYAEFPAENAINADHALRAVFAAASTITLALDLGSAVAVTFVGYSGLYVPGNETALNPTVIDIHSTASAPPQTLSGSTLRASISRTARKNGRDGFAIISNPGHRYWYMSAASSGSDIALSSLVLGSHTDLGIAFTPGSRESEVLARVTTRTAGQERHDTKIGPNRFLLDYIFNSVPRATVDIIRDFAVQGGYILSPTGECFTVAAADDVTPVAVWGNPELYDVRIACESLP